MKHSVINNQGRLTAEGITDISTAMTGYEFESPKHLLHILAALRNFQAYEQACINLEPANVITHEWLLHSTVELDRQLSSILVKLSRAEKFIDQNNRVVELHNVAEFG